jgi:hypothetical protein
LCALFQRHEGNNFLSLLQLSFQLECWRSLNILWMRQRKITSMGSSWKSSYWAAGTFGSKEMHSSSFLRGSFPASL